jgi:hypothetical protein
LNLCSAFVDFVDAVFVALVDGDGDAMELKVDDAESDEGAVDEDLRDLATNVEETFRFPQSGQEVDVVVMAVEVTTIHPVEILLNVALAFIVILTVKLLVAVEDRVFAEERKVLLNFDFLVFLAIFFLVNDFDKDGSSDG